MGDYHSMGGAIEILGRCPKEIDNFYFEYLVTGTNYIHRFLKFDEWDAKKSDLAGEIRPMRRAMLLSRNYYIGEKVTTTRRPLKLYIV